MLQIKINKEVKDVKENFIMGFTMRQSIFSICAVVVALLIYFLGKDKLNKDILTMLIILCDVPIACFGFVKYQNMYFEQLITEVIKSYLCMPKILSNIPVNTYKAIEKELDDNSPEGIKERQINTIKKVLVTTISVVLFIVACIGVSNFAKMRSIENYKEEQMNALLSNYTQDSYFDEELKKFDSITQSCYEQLSNVSNIEHIDTIIYSTNIQLNAVNTCNEVASEKFNQLYINDETVKNNNNLKLVVNQLTTSIYNTKTVTETNIEYDNAIRSIEMEIKEFQKNNEVITNEKTKSKSANR